MSSIQYVSLILHILIHLFWVVLVERDQSIFLLNNNSGLSDNLLAATVHELLHFAYDNLSYTEEDKLMMLY